MYPGGDSNELWAFIVGTYVIRASQRAFLEKKKISSGFVDVIVSVFMKLLNCIQDQLVISTPAVISTPEIT